MRQAFDLVRPRGEAAAFGAAAEKPSSYIGGGTDLMQLLKDHDQSPQRLVDLDFVLSNVIEVQFGSLRIGALSRISDTAAHPRVLRDLPVVSQALLASAAAWWIPKLREAIWSAASPLASAWLCWKKRMSIGMSDATSTWTWRSTWCRWMRISPTSRPTWCRTMTRCPIRSARRMGELPMVGVAAVANAVYHATGRRVRRVPIRIEDVLSV